VVCVSRPARRRGVERAVADRRIGAQPKEELAQLAVPGVRGEMERDLAVAQVDVVPDSGQQLDAAGVCALGRVDQRAGVSLHDRRGKRGVARELAVDRFAFAPRAASEQVVDGVGLGRLGSGREQQLDDLLCPVIARQLDRSQAAQCRVLRTPPVGVDAVAEQERDAIGVAVVGGEDERVLEQELRLGQMLAEPLRPRPATCFAEPIRQEKLKVVVRRPEMAL
jgi:hypothetical protein